MNSKISDLALDFGAFALDIAIETGEMPGASSFASFPDECVDAVCPMMESLDPGNSRCLVTGF